MAAALAQNLGGNGGSGAYTRAARTFHCQLERGPGAALSASDGAGRGPWGLSKDELDKHLPEVRNRLIFLLSSKTFADIGSTQEVRFTG
jgi:hypothetical protein